MSLASLRVRVSVGVRQCVCACARAARPVQHVANAGCKPLFEAMNRSIDQMPPALTGPLLVQLRSMSILSRRNRKRTLSNVETAPAVGQVLQDSAVEETEVSTVIDEHHREEELETALTDVSTKSYSSPAEGSDAADAQNEQKVASGVEAGKAGTDPADSDFKEILREIEEAQMSIPLAPMPIPDRQMQEASGLMAWEVPMHQAPVQPANPRSLSVAIIGIPNAGKSTLLNQVLGSKLAIVSHREQTTRNRILGILTEGETQVVLHDTPGIVEAARARRLKLSKGIVTAGAVAAQETDMVLMLIDATMSPPERQLEVLKDLGLKSVTLIINKVDQVKPRSLLLPMVDILREQCPVPVDNIFMVSALKNSGVDDLKEYLFKHAVARDWAFSADQVTDMSPVQRIHDQVREKYMDVATELPYIFKQRTESVRWSEDGSLLIHHSILVTKRSQKGMLVGQAGNRINRVTTAVQRELESIFSCPVTLVISIDVNKNLNAMAGAS